MLLAFNLSADKSKDSGNFGKLQRDIKNGNPIYIDVEREEADKNALINQDVSGKNLLMYALENIQYIYSYENLEKLMTNLDKLEEKDRTSILTARDSQGRSILYYFIQGFYNEKLKCTNCKYENMKSSKAFDLIKKYTEVIYLINAGDVCDEKKGTTKSKECVSGKTPIMHAAETGYQEIVDVLIKNEADVNAKDNKGNSCIMYAINSFSNAVNIDKRNSYLDLIKYLHGKGVALGSEETGTNALMLASKEAYHNDLLKMFIDDLEIDINAQDKNGLTAVMYAAIEGNKSTVEFLVGKGADLLIKSKKDWTVKDYIQDELNNAYSKYMSIDGTTAEIKKAKSNYKKWKDLFKYVKKEFKKQEKNKK